MIDIPIEVEIKSTIKPGSVYYFKEEELHSEEPHFFIVINKEPIDYEMVLLVCSSSLVEKVKQTRGNLKQFKGTLVEIKKRDYPGFSTDSIVDCNNVFPRTFEELVDKLKDGDLKIKPEMDISIIEEIREAVLRSCVVEPEIIDMLI